MNDQTIKDALEAIAATAVAPERVRARIDARARAHRQRRALLAAAGVATVTTAVGVPLALRDQRPTLPSPAQPPEPVAEPRTMSLLFAPQWLPDGVAEQFRSVKYDTATGEVLGGSRSWYPAGAPYSLEIPKGSVTLMIDERIDDGSGEPVMVGPARGTLRVTDSAWVEWQPAGGPVMVVSVYGTGDDTANALRVARSVAATDETATVTMRAPLVPQAFDGHTLFEVFPAADGGRQSLTVASDDLRNHFVLQTSPPESGQPFQSVERNGIMVYLPREVPGVEVVDGGARLTDDEAREVLERVECLPPDLSWVGGR
ncbi:hypothetical protein [Actinoplanes sp. DH11]|uniref:hypothetical protein n=1 Tax=Actinoplanes sp. DH11 TaxID=2857011 RepID=UPI001E60780C|nr:hypothetical protein [Actinoplanes sp. DH11]